MVGRRRSQVRLLVQINEILFLVKCASSLNLSVDGLINPSNGAKTKYINRLRQIGIRKENDIISITLLQENLTIKSIVEGLNKTYNTGNAIKNC